MNYMKAMSEFHKMFHVPIGVSPKLLEPKDNIRRLTLITSEVGELGDAVRQKDLIETSDALGDLLYVTFGMATEMGLPMDEVFKQIHESNLSKLWPDNVIFKDLGGKVIKSPGYHPVNLSWLDI